jgi:hypothetical protein
MVLAALLALPCAARAAPLLDEGLRPPDLGAPSLSLYDAGTLVAQASQPAKPAAKPAKPPPSSLDFDLLGAETAAPKVDDKALKKRRAMLNAHQLIGFGIGALELATVVVGQLNYDDKFNGPNTNKYKQTHQILAWTTVGLFLVNGTLALLAPDPLKTPHKGWDRTTTHKVAMFTALGLMLLEGALGYYTTTREGNLDQQTVTTVHLGLGYGALLATGIGVGALVF